MCGRELLYNLARMRTEDVGVEERETPRDVGRSMKRVEVGGRNSKPVAPRVRRAVEMTMKGVY